MHLHFIVCLFLILPTLSLAADCEDRDLFDENLLSAAVTELVEAYGAKASKQTIASCESGFGTRSIKLNAHEQDEHYTYYRMVNCVLGNDPSELSCESAEGRRIKYRDTTIDTDKASDDKEFNEQQTKNYIAALDCFHQGLQAGTVKVRKYNRLLDTTLDIPLAVNSEINAIKILPGFKRYIVNATPERSRFSVELDREYGCFIEPLK
ncbi:MAG: hypothetical protein ACJA1I_001580 [Zhongshania marina]|jgi:hypothetical protein